MGYEQRYTELKNENISLKKIINSGMSEIDEKIEAKRKLYQNKIEMLDMIDKKEEAKRTGVNAAEYIIRAKNKKHKPTYSCGISKIDSHLSGGFETGQLINIAGESFAGKTELTMNICSNMANGFKVAWFNFEMGEKNFIRRLQRLEMSEKQSLNFYIDEDSRNIDKLLEEMTLLIQDGYFVFGIDSKMKLTGGQGREDYQKFSNISTRLSEFAQTQDVIIFFINQMNEEDIKNKRLALKGSGDQKYDSDILLFMVLEEDKNRDKNIEDLDRYLICTKNRQTERTFKEKITTYDYKSSIVEVTEFNADMPQF
jgi:replicative DNA helicase